jgi:hypothetical protein
MVSATSSRVMRRAGRASPLPPTGWPGRDHQPGAHQRLQGLGDPRGGDPPGRPENGCVSFTFGFLPTDAVPQVICPPKGYPALPSRSVNPDEGDPRTHFQLIDQNWLYRRREVR